MNLPRFTAELALRRTTQVYQDNRAFPTDGSAEVQGQTAALPLIPPLNTFVDAGVIYTLHDGIFVPDCPANCALSCSSVNRFDNPELYASCYEACYNAYCTRAGGTTGVACNADQLKACQSEHPPGDPFRGDCYFFYGPCGPGKTCCGSGGEQMCVSLLYDSQNCGFCGHRCAPGDFCCRGTCCPSGSSCCGGACCGGPGTNTGCCEFTGATSATSGGTPTCVSLLPNGQPSGELYNPFNCGVCGNVCGAGQSCCGGACVSLQTNATNCGACGQSCKAGQSCINGCCLSNIANPPVLQSNQNYLLINKCNSITGLSVLVNVTQTMTSANGFSMQLNAYNPAGPTTSWMQYVFIISGNTISGSVQYWNIALFNAPGSTCKATPSNCQTFAQNTSTIVNLPSNNVPAGYALRIQLGNDNAGNITQATFVVIDNNNNSHSQTVTLPAASQFPIVAFQTNIVGPFNGANTAFTGGAGTITYQVSTGQLCLEGGLADQCSTSAGNNTPTAETSNATYGAIASCCGSLLAQTLTA
jgi:Stigma-specific protein, Stig1